MKAESSAAGFFPSFHLEWVLHCTVSVKKLMILVLFIEIYFSNCHPELTCSPEKWFVKVCAMRNTDKQSSDWKAALNIDQIHFTCCYFFKLFNVLVLNLLSGFGHIWEFQKKMRVRVGRIFYWGFIFVGNQKQSFFSVSDLKALVLLLDWLIQDELKSCSIKIPIL